MSFDIKPNRIDSQEEILAFIQANSLSTAETIDLIEANAPAPAAPSPKTVMCINFGGDNFATYTIDGSSWFKTATSNGTIYMRPMPSNMASSGDTTVIYTNNISTPGNNDVVLLVYKNFYNPSTATLVASFTKQQIVNIASAGNVSNLDSMGIVANENGTFVISFMYGPKFLVSTDYGLTWSLSNSITAPAGGEGEGEFGSWMGFYYYPSYSSVTNKFYVKGFSAAGYLSSSDGITWTTTNVPNSSSGSYPIFVDALGNIVAGHGYSGVAYSTNGGTSWSYGYNQDFIYSTNHVMVGSTIYFNNYGTIKAISIDGLARGSNAMYWYNHQNLGQGGIQYYMQSKDKVMYSGNGTYGTIGTADATNVMQFIYPRIMASTYTSTVNATALTVPAEFYNKMIGA